MGVSPLWQFAVAELAQVNLSHFEMGRPIFFWLCAGVSWHIMMCKRAVCFVCWVVLGCVVLCVCLYFCLF